ncbi:calcium ion binding protein [Aureococcus anophagefferens]|nr:calcium ion binding protein [Aureococcus anophagefferens]
MPAFGDTDGDGDLDLVLGERLGSPVGWGNVGSPTAPDFSVSDKARPVYMGAGQALAFAPALGDVDGDGDLDLARAGLRGAAGLANPLRALDVGAYAAPALGDLDGDGDLDLVVGAEDGSFWFFYSDGAAPPSFHGFTGAQCGECQRGFWGNACDLCPEGGGEDRDAPRIVDTCGVAGSGRSRGACDEGFAGTGACACVEPFHGANCTLGECPSGTFEDDAQSATPFRRAPARLRPGQVLQRGGRPPSSASCAEPSTTIGASSTSCDACVAGHYMSRDGDCEYCDEDGHACDVAGITVATLVVRRGHWRGSAATTTTYACPRSKNCKGGAAAGDDPAAATPRASSATCARATTASPRAASAASACPATP